MEPPVSASPLYKTLHATGLEFVRSQNKDDAQPSRMSIDRIRAIRSSENFEHSWGHDYFVNTAPHLQGTLDIDGFVAHLNKMCPFLESWDTNITDVMVDEQQKRVVLRASYYMLVKGAEAPVENDLVWFLTMDEEGRKVKKSMASSALSNHHFTLSRM